MKRCTAVCCAWAASVMLAPGVVLLTDSIDYTNGPLITVSGGRWGHHSPSGSSTGQVDVVSGRVFLNHSEAEDVNALLQGAPYPSSTNLHLYASFTVNFSSLPDGAASSYFAHFKDNTTSGFRARIFTTTNGAPAGTLRIGVGNSGSSPTAVISNNLSLGSDHTVVIRYVITNATTTLWLDPASESSPGVTATDSVSALSISAFALRQPSSINDGVGYGNLYFDNLVVGSAFADVTAVPTNSPPGFSLVTYNVKGNGASDWSTNAPQVRAIARQLQFLNPDIITFNELPFDLSYEMTNFVAAFLPGYSLAQSPNGDGFIRSSIASRFPITRSQSLLAHADLTPFGYTNVNPSLDNFTRDLFEAQISLPHFPQPLHIFTTHLKATSGNPEDDGAKRAAEAGAISNYFVAGFLTTNALHTYVLTGDLNEDINRPVSTNQPVQRLISAATGLQLTTPRNPFNNDDRTWSIQGGLSVRLDYLLPCGLLFSNIASSQIFRADLLTNPPTPLLTNDVTASDHLPVMMVFNSPYDKPFRLLSITRSNPVVSLTWQSVPGQPYRVDSSSNLAAWAGLASNLVASGTSYSLVTNVTSGMRFFRVYRVP